MGTRADFYDDSAGKMEWLGSIAFDGYPDGIPDAVKDAMTVEWFRAAMATFFNGREDATLPAQGWPWPWNDSRGTDFAYAFRGGSVVCWHFGYGPVPINSQLLSVVRERCKRDSAFPDMSARQNVTFGPGSGVIVFDTNF